jgi:hypothetical protein
MTDDLMTQAEARQQAAQLRQEGIPAVAGAVPLGSWGGHEQGWAVYIGNPYADMRGAA